MRWMWIDRIVEHEPGARLVAVKNVSLAEEHIPEYRIMHQGSDQVGGAAQEDIRPAPTETDAELRCVTLPWPGIRMD